MTASRRFLPISLVLMLAATTGVAWAGSSLDPYDHIKAPAPKKKEKEKPVLPSVEDVDVTKTYVSMPYGNLDPEHKKKGLIGKMVPPMPGKGALTAPIKSASSGVKAIGGGIASGAKASGGLAKKSATVIGSRLKPSAGKSNDAKDAKDAPQAIAQKQEPPRSKRTIEDMYSKEAKQALAFKQKEAKRKPSKLGKLNPLGKLAGRNKAVESHPNSGFLDGAMNKNYLESDIASKGAKKEEAIASKKKEESLASPHSADKEAGITAEVANAGKDNEKKIAKAKGSKKGKFPHIHVAKIKRHKDKHLTNVAENPRGSGFVAGALEKKEMSQVQKTAVAPVSAPAPEKEGFDWEPPDSNAAKISSMPTGDKAIDSVQPPKSKPDGAVGAIASKPHKAHKKKTLVGAGVGTAVGGMGVAVKGGLSVLGLHKKKHSASPATADGPNNAIQ